LKGIVAVCALPDGNRIVSISKDKPPRVWDVNQKICLRELIVHDCHPDAISENFTSVCALSDGYRVVVGSTNKILHVWNVNTGRDEGQLHGHVGVSPFLSFVFF
jgi:WD40 repeat protein